MSQQVHANNVVWIYPRRKAGEKDAGTSAKGRPAMQLGYSAVAALFDIPQGEAAQRLGISLTALKTASRKLGISRWPYTRVKKVYARATTLAPSVGLQAGERFRHGSQSQVLESEERQAGDLRVQPDGGGEGDASDGRGDQVPAETAAQQEQAGPHKSLRTKKLQKLEALRGASTEDEGAGGGGRAAPAAARGRPGRRRGVASGGAAPPSQSMCRHPEGCTRSASFGESTSEARLFCARHREAHHEDKKHKLCSVPSCRRQGVFRRVDGTGARVCASHCSTGLRAAVGAGTCTAAGCLAPATHAPPVTWAQAQARRNASGDPVNGSTSAAQRNRQPTRKTRAMARWCTAHQPAGSIDVRTGLCCAPGCEARATRGVPGRAPAVCAAHRRPGDVDRRHKRCQYAPDQHTGLQATVGCERQPSYGDAADGVARFCSQHRGPSHVDVRSRCRQRALSADSLVEDEGSGVCAGTTSRRRAPLVVDRVVATCARRLRGTEHAVEEILWRDDFATVTILRDPRP